MDAMPSEYTPRQRVANRGRTSQSFKTPAEAPQSVLKASQKRIPALLCRDGCSIFDGHGERPASICTEQLELARKSDTETA